MPLRVTQTAITNRTQLNFQISQSRLDKLTQQLSTGRRLLRPSDDPSASARIDTFRAEDLRFDTHLQTIADSSGILERSVVELQSASDIMTRASEIALEAQNGTTFDETRATFVREVESLLGDLEAVANGRLADGRYLFSGTASDTAPFTVQNLNSGQRYSYNGADQDSLALVDVADTTPTLISGERAFQSRARGATVLLPVVANRETGAAAGSGTDSATGFGSLVVQHTLTTYDAGAGSGIAAGTSSAADDTVLGPAGTHTVTINDTSGTGTTGTISLNGGPAVIWNNGDTNLRVDDENGHSVFVDTTGITAGFAGSVDITGDGQLSTDNGTTFTAIDFTSANQVVTNSETGEVTFIDSTGINRAGVEQVDYQGTYDAFQVLVALRDDLQNTTTRGDLFTANIQRRLVEIERVQSHTLEVMGDQAFHAERLSSLETRIQSLQFAVQDEVIGLEQVDFAEAIVSMQSEENIFQIGLAMAGRVNNLSLLDFLG